MGGVPELTPAWRRGLLGLALALASLAVLAAGAVLAAHRLPLPARVSAADSVVVEYREGSPLHVFLSEDDKWRLPVSLDELDPAYVEALLRLEDRRFHLHPGVDPLAVLRAAWQNVTSGRVVSGASTLSMQLARLTEPRPRTLTAKLLEALRAVRLELLLTKREVLEAYLRLVPYGRNVEGVQAASLSYFGHRAGALTRAEIAVLLAVPQAPGARHPRPDHVAALRAARDRVAARVFDAAGVAEVRGALVPERLLPFPRQAPHAAVWLRAAHPGAPRLRTTLDPDVQPLAERVLAGARSELALQGIHNAAAVVVDHEGGEVRALVGNVDFSDAQHGGQIPGFATPRSPGSLLKPFLYALALDRGLALPEHLVRDVPARWGTYAPENYDGRYSGLVRLEDALSRSLNVPFVRLLSEVGVEPFLGLLDQLGARHVDPRPGHYGLSAAVGGVEVTPLEAAGLFASLAEDGRYRPPRLLADAPPAGPARPVLTPGAAWLTRRALARRDRPDFPSRARVAAVPRRVHWKTGTSYGHRDAWAAGSGPRHTAVVWLGNFDWTPSAALVGSDAVGPLLFDLLDGVADRRHLPPPDPPPPDLVEVEVCRTSGHLPTEACPERRTTLAPERSVATARCPFHVRLDVDEETGLALAPRCRAGRRHTARSFLVWPAGVRRWLRDRLHDAPAPPPWAPGCAPPEPDRPPAIVSPPAGHALLLIPGVPPERQEVPLEADTAGAGEVSWFVDGEWLGTVDPADRLWWRPSPGEHHLRVVDEAGQSSARTLVVRGRR